jgi:hypothetical protein
MGRAELVTAPALRDFQEYAETVARVLRCGDLSSGSLHLVRVHREIAEASMTFAHNRIQVADLATHTVRDARNIETKCARARISSLVFDLGPDEAA